MLTSCLTLGKPLSSSKPLSSGLHLPLFYAYGEALTPLGLDSKTGSLGRPLRLKEVIKVEV